MSASWWETACLLASRKKPSISAAFPGTEDPDPHGHTITQKQKQNTHIHARAHVCITCVFVLVCLFFFAQSLDRLIEETQKVRQREAGG